MVSGRRFDKWLEGYDDIVDHKYVLGPDGIQSQTTECRSGVGSVQLLKFDRDS